MPHDVCDDLLVSVSFTGRHAVYRWLFIPVEGQSQHRVHCCFP